MELCRNLIRYDTSNPPGNEADCISYISSLLAGAGFETTLVGKSPERPNLITRLRGKGNAPSLLMYGHVDVVTAANQKWSHPPFEAKLVDGFIWGRGALDMKSGVAMMLAAILRAKAEGLTARGDVVLAVVSDEEGGGEFGAKYLVADHIDSEGTSATYYQDERKLTVNITAVSRSTSVTKQYQVTQRIDSDEEAG